MRTFPRTWDAAKVLAQAKARTERKAAKATAKNALRLPKTEAKIEKAPARQRAAGGTQGRAARGG